MPTTSTTTPRPAHAYCCSTPPTAYCSSTRWTPEDTGHPLVSELPGGGLDEGENLLDAASTRGRRGIWDHAPDPGP